MGHVAVPELTLSGRQDSNLRDTWQCRSSPQQGGEVRSHGTHGSARAHLNKKVRSDAVGHIAALKHTSVGSCGINLQLACQRVDAQPAPYLGLIAYMRGYSVFRVSTSNKDEEIFWGGECRTSWRWMFFGRGPHDYGLPFFKNSTG
jgi:hypothetical protein